MNSINKKKFEALKAICEELKPKVDIPIYNKIKEVLAMPDTERQETGILKIDLDIDAEEKLEELKKNFNSWVNDGILHYGFDPAYPKKSEDLAAEQSKNNARIWKELGGKFPLITNVRLDARAINVLRFMGVVTIEEISQFTEAQILRQKNSGKKTLHNIKKVLKAYGLRLSEYQRQLINTNPVKNGIRTLPDKLGVVAVLAVDQDDFLNHLKGLERIFNIEYIHSIKQAEDRIFCDVIVTDDYFWKDAECGFSQLEKLCQNRTRRIVS